MKHRTRHRDRSARALCAAPRSRRAGAPGAIVALLVKWNPTIRLVSPPDLAAIWPRHIADSLQLLPLIPAGLDGAIDLGSGGGLPGLVLAIATGIHFDLVESDSRKAAFLSEAAIATRAPVTVHASRIEEVRLPRGGLVTARALAPLAAPARSRRIRFWRRAGLPVPQGRNGRCRTAARQSSAGPCACKAFRAGPLPTRASS